MGTSLCMGPSLIGRSNAAQTVARRTFEGKGIVCMRRSMLEGPGVGWLIPRLQDKQPPNETNNTKHRMSSSSLRHDFLSLGIWGSAARICHSKFEIYMAPTKAKSSRKLDYSKSLNQNKIGSQGVKIQGARQADSQSDDSDGYGGRCLGLRQWWR